MSETFDFKSNAYTNSATRANENTWRHLPDLNWCTRFCRPLRNHSAKAPPKSIISYLEVDGKLFGAQDLDIERATEVFLDETFKFVQCSSEIGVVL